MARTESKSTSKSTSKSRTKLKLKPRPARKYVQNKRPRKKTISITIPYKFQSLNERTFYHSQSYRAFMINADEKIADSDEEGGTLDQMLQQKDIDEFMDLNEGEKQMFSMWNQFVRNVTSFGTGHMRAICDSFINSHAREIIQKKLYRNFLLHLCSLHDFGLLKQEDVFHLVEHLQLCAGLGLLKNSTNKNAAAYQSSDAHSIKMVTRKRKATSTVSDNNDGNNNNVACDMMPPKKKRCGLRSSTSPAHS